MMKSTGSKSASSSRKFSKQAALLIVALVVLVGGYIIYRTQAAGLFASVEPELNPAVNVKDPAKVVPDPTASGGQAVQFNAATSTGSTFLSYPKQTARTSVNGGSNVVISNRSYQGFTGQVAITVSGANNVYIHDVDFDNNGGDIFLINCTGQIRIENIRARGTGMGAIGIGSGKKNVIQLNNTWDNGTGGIRRVYSYGGQTEDVISIFKSGGLDDARRLIIEDIHLEGPLPPDPLAWNSNSGTGVNMGDAGGHDIELRNSTILNTGAVGIQIHEGIRVHVRDNIVYGAARPLSNVGLSQWAASSCSACVGNDYTRNRVWWVKSNGTPSPMWLSGTAQVADVNNVKQDTTINPASLKVVL